MKIKLIIFNLLIISVFANGQKLNDTVLTRMVLGAMDTNYLTSFAFSFDKQTLNKVIEPLKKIAMSSDVRDSIRMTTCLNVSKFYIDINNDTAILYAKESRKIAQKTNDRYFEAQANDVIGAISLRMGNTAEGLDALLKAEKVFLERSDSTYLKVVNRNFGDLYKIQGDIDVAKKYYYKSISITPKTIPDTLFHSWALMNLGGLYLEQNQIDSAYYFSQEANRITYKSITVIYSHKYLPIVYNNLGKILAIKGNYAEAKDYFQKGIDIATANYYSQGVGDIHLSMADMFKKNKQIDSALYHAKRALRVAALVNTPISLEKAATFLTMLYKEQNNIDSAYYYQNIMLSAININRNTDKIKQVQNAAFKEQLDKQAAEADRKNNRNKMILWGLTTLLAVFSMGGYLLYRNNRQKQKTNLILNKANNDLQLAQTQLEHKNRDLEIEAALEKIRSTSLAMHHSNEIENVVAVFFDKLKELGLVFDGGTGIHIFTEGSQDAVIWVFAPFQPPTKINLPYDEAAFENNIIILDVWNAHNTGTHIFNKTYSFEEKNKYFNYVFKHNDYVTVPEEARNFILSVPNYTASFVAEKHSLIGANSWTGQTFSESDFEILKRIARVFEQAYVRFLDLQKAEAQAREAQIEAALEKIRSQSLAMHRSDELEEVMKVLLEKLKELNVATGTIALQFFDEKTKNCDFWVSNDLQHIAKVKLPYDEKFFAIDNYMKHCWEAKEKGQSIINKLYLFEQKNAYFDYVFANNDFDNIPKVSRDFIYQAPSHITTLIIESHSALFADNWFGQNYSDDKIVILKRVAKVFNQAYVRFLDLQKAETQAREAQIEVALERVRARAMAMQKSEELAEAAQLLYKEFGTLGINTLTCGYMFIDEDTNKQTAWVTLPDGTLLPNYIVFPLTGDHVLDKRYASWKNKELLHKHQIEGEVNKEHHWFLSQQVPESVAKDIFAHIPNKITFYSANFSSGYLLILATDFFSTDEEQIIIRFAKVFELTYTRFSDLKQAEEQAREAQIEVSLERVRSRTLAMQNSEELSSIIGLIYTEMGKLNVELQRCFFMIFHPENLGVTWWMASGESLDLGKGFFVPYSEHPPQLAYVKGWQKRQERWQYLMQGEEKQLWDTYLFNETELVALPTFIKEAMQSYTSIYLQSSFNSFGCLTTGNVDPISDEALDLMVRYSKVFDLSFTRFNDLKNAEAQAREAKIETVLERIRNRALVMNTSDELNALINVIYNECIKLDMNLDRSLIITYDKETNDSRWWIAGPEATGVSTGHLVKYHEYAPSLALLKGWHDRAQKWSYIYEGEDKKTWNEYVFNHTGLKDLPPPMIAGMNELPRVIFNCSFQNFGCIMLPTTEPMSDEHFELMVRLGKVIDLAYTRYLHLQFKEEQAREAQIEASLERVRSRTMAMQHSNELAEAASILFSEVNRLGVNAFASVFHIWEPDMVSTKCWANGGEGLQPPLRIPHTVEPFHQRIYDAWKKGEQYFEMVAEGAELEATYRFMHTLINGSNVLENIENSGFNIPKKQFTHCAFFLQGYIMINAYEKPNISQDVFMRFAKVFEQTYTRFLDLQKAETQAREAQIEAALEKIRATALAMDSPDDFYMVVQTLREQLLNLGQTEWETSVIQFYYPEKGYIEAWYIIQTAINEDDKPQLGTTRIFFNACALTKRYLTEYLSSQTEYTIQSSGDELGEWIDYLISVTPQAKDRIRASTNEIMYYHHSKFSAGTLVMVAHNKPTEETKYLQHRAAKVFDLAYKRYLDLQLKDQLAKQAELDFENLKVEKKKTEDALSELRSTQAQLIQKEKLASLGELTAGIAHEIQNPLNFVNNFSELSVGIAQELKEELNKSDVDKDFVEELLNDLTQNQDKINHHGKRASNIVRGMLEHSRTSTGERVLTDINALCDEYLRLSYHGMRAKDKDFNADYKTDFDENLPKIEVIPQDMGRVLLNLINNAFYAGHQKAKTTEDYTPSVFLTTKQFDNKIIITVKDNGNGIPDNIKDKIFQPFFTTKPTGEGTGLGLSLSYDIVTKGHGGTLEVESSVTPERDGAQGDKRGGSEFIIRLPI